MVQILQSSPEWHVQGAEDIGEDTLQENETLWNECEAYAAILKARLGNTNCSISPSPAYELADTAIAGGLHRYKAVMKSCASADRVADILSGMFEPVVVAHILRLVCFSLATLPSGMYS
jgi:hypothetical protein